MKREGDGASPIGQFRIVGGYYRPETAKAESVMRPSAKLNEIIGSLT